MLGWSSRTWGRSSFVSSSRIANGTRVVVVFLIFCSFGPSTGPTERLTEIAYWGSEPDGAGIYLVNERGENPQLITATDGYVACLSWSPDGRRIAFAQSNGQELVYQIWIADVEALADTQITSGPDEHTCPSWSPTGSRIAYFFRQTDSNTYTLRSLSPNGSSDQLMSAARVGPNRAAWSPDGRFVAVQMHEPFGQIGLLDALTGGIVDTLTAAGTLGNWAPIWSSSADKIAFATQRDGVLAIYVMNPDGSDQRRIGPFGPPPFGGATWPTWSPDGRRIAYEYNTEGSGLEAEIRTSPIAVDTGVVVVPNARQPAWRPTPP